MFQRRKHLGARQKAFMVAVNLFTMRKMMNTDAQLEKVYQGKLGCVRAIKSCTVTGVKTAEVVH